MLTIFVYFAIIVMDYELKSERLLQKIYGRKRDGYINFLIAICTVVTHIKVLRNNCNHLYIEIKTKCFSE